MLEVFAHRQSRGFRLMLQNCLHDILVVVGASSHRFSEVDPMALSVHVPHDLFVQFDKRMVAGAVHDRKMELIVECVVALCVKGVGGIAHLAMNAPDFIQDFSFRGFRHTRGRELFQANQDFHSLPDFDRIGICHDRPNVGNKSYQAFGIEHFQCLPQRRARNPELLA